MPRWAGQADPASAAHWTGTDTPGPAARNHGSAAGEPDDGPEINDISQLLDAVTIGHAVAYVPVSVAAQFRSAGLAVVPVSDLSPSQVMVAWPDTSRSAAVAAFVRVTVAAAQAEATAQAEAAAQAETAAQAEAADHQPVRPAVGSVSCATMQLS